MEVPDSGTRRTVGLTMVVSGFALTLLSILFGIGTIPVAPGAVIPVSVALAAAAMFDLVLGLVFIRQGD